MYHWILFTIYIILCIQEYKPVFILMVGVLIWGLNTVDTLFILEPIHVYVITHFCQLQKLHHNPDLKLDGSDIPVVN